MLSSSLDTLLKVSKTTSPQKLFAYDCVTLYNKHVYHCFRIATYISLTTPTYLGSAIEKILKPPPVCFLFLYFFIFFSYFFFFAYSYSNSFYFFSRSFISNCLNCLLNITKICAAKKHAKFRVYRKLYEDR